MTQDSVHGTVCDVVNRVLTDTGRPAREFNAEDTLTETIGLDSLDLAVMVVSLEQALGMDPFRAGAKPVATIGELIELYNDSLRDAGDVGDET